MARIVDTHNSLKDEIRRLQSERDEAYHAIVLAYNAIQSANRCPRGSAQGEQYLMNALEALRSVARDVTPITAGQC
jgi:hypothetical protein